MLPDAHSTQNDDGGADAIVVLHDATWADYQRVKEIRGDRRFPRLAYLQGALELMSPSKDHELLKTWVGRLVEVWCTEAGVEFSGYGSWTLESEQLERGVEPDECYVFGSRPDAKRPDLAIEVVWTSAGIDKREIYRKLGVRELWIYRKGGIAIHVLRGEAFEEAQDSEVLPGIDLAELVQFLDRPTTSQAIRDYRAALQARRRQ